MTDAMRWKPKMTREDAERLLDSDIESALALDPVTLIEPAQLVEDVAQFLQRYLVVSDHQATALALWVVHTHAVDAADATPYIRISSAEPACGKTLLLEVLELLVAKPWLTARATGPSVQRRVSAQQPTLLLDETDASFKGNHSNEMLRGILNSGYRRGGKVTVAEGGNGTEGYREYSTFCAKAFAGIGSLPDTLMSRSISIRLERKTADEVVDRFRSRKARPRGEDISLQVRDWVYRHFSALQSAEPDLPVELSDRSQDVWEPLFAIADEVGGSWPQRARTAAVALATQPRSSEPTFGQHLLSDIRDVFRLRDSDRMTTADIVEALQALPESPWQDYRDRGFNQRDMAGVLDHYGLKSHSVRLTGDTFGMGYYRRDFEKVWERYVGEGN